MTTSPASVRDIEIKLGDGNVLHCVNGGSKLPAFILVHGGHRQLQNADHWKSWYSFLASHGSFYSVDLLGHGKSTPNADSNRHIDASHQVQALMQLIAEREDLVNCKDLILVGRSYGGGIVMRLLMEVWRSRSAYSGVAFGGHKVILIAPSIPEEVLHLLPEDLLSQVDFHVIWAKDDGVVPMSQLDSGGHHSLRSVLSKAHSVSYTVIEKAIPAGEEESAAWKAHMPELMRQSEVEKSLHEWLTKHAPSALDDVPPTIPKSRSEL